MKRVIISLPYIEDKKAENVIKELIRQINLCLDDIDKEIRKSQESKKND